MSGREAGTPKKPYAGKSSGLEPIQKPYTGPEKAAHRRLLVSRRWLHLAALSSLSLYVLFHLFVRVPGARNDAANGTHPSARKQRELLESAAHPGTGQIR